MASRGRRLSGKEKELYKELLKRETTVTLFSLPDEEQDNDEPLMTEHREVNGIPPDSPVESPVPVAKEAPQEEEEVKKKKVTTISTLESTTKYYQHKLSDT
jgi:hypothetical protein